MTLHNFETGKTYLDGDGEEWEILGKGENVGGEPVFRAKNKTSRLRYFYYDGSAFPFDQSKNLTHREATK